MSYLDTPRICFTGTFTANGPTRNNLLAALDDPTVLGQNPPWDNNPLANGDFTLAQCQVRSAVSADGRVMARSADDAVIGAAVLGSGKMADLDPEHRRVTELIGMMLTISLPDDGTGAAPASVSGKLEATPLRDYWLDPSSGIATAWQSAIRKPWWSAGIERSDALKQLRDARPDGLSVRLTTIAVPTDTGLLTRLVGALGPWSAAEPQQFVAARRLIASRPPGQLAFPVASCQVDSRRGKLVVDLSNLPTSPTKPGSDPAIRGLVAYITKPGRGGLLTTIGSGRDLTVDQWANAGGIVEWDLTPDQGKLLQSNLIGVSFDVDSGPILMEEHPSGLYVDVDRRSLRLNPGESAGVDVYARRSGQPLPGQVVTFALHRQKAIAAVETILDTTDFGYPPQPDLPINSEPAEVILPRPGPLQVVTDQDGYARLTVTARPGEIALPEARRNIDSQLYFLGEPDGWQSWGAIGPNNGQLSSNRVGAGCALTVLVFNTHDPIAAPKWEDIEPWLSRYALLYPAMLKEAHLNLGVKDQVDRDAYEIYRRLNCLDPDDVQSMPISRDLSAFRRRTILAYLRSVMPGRPPC